MKATTKPAPKAIAPEVLTLIEQIEERNQALEATLYRLSGIVKLAAFAAEARRMLEAHDSALKSFPEAAAHIFDTVESSRQWECMADATGEVLTAVSDQLAGVADGAGGADDHIYRLRKVLEVAA